MKRKKLHLSMILFLPALIALFWRAAPVNAQSMPSRDNGTTREELARFDQFLDSHREISEQLRKSPPLVNNDKFLNDHAALKTYLQDHPGIREEVRENPYVFMRQEERFDRREDARFRDNDTTRAELAQFDRFLDSHREVSEQLHKNPSLVNDHKFVNDHAALQTYLQQHPQVTEEIRENPNAFMRQENRFDRQEEARFRDNDTTRAELAQFDRFLDSHREVSEQLHKNPSLVNNGDYVEDHPDLSTFLHEHPGVRDEVRENPNSFMRQENRFDRQEDTRFRDREQDRDRDVVRGEKEGFDRFLNDHREIGEQVRKNPSLVNDDDFARKHPPLQSYLQEHPGVRDQARQKPDDFMQRDSDRWGDGWNRDRDRDWNRDRDRDWDRDRDHDRSASFREFLGSHSEVAQQLSRNPALAKDQDFMKGHPEFQDYLKNHPDVNQELMKNPDSFVNKWAQPANTNPNGNSSNSGNNTQTNGQGNKNPASRP
jgi:dsDNA-binding SOS-regulon protein